MKRTTHCSVILRSLTLTRTRISIQPASQIKLHTSTHTWVLNNRCPGSLAFSDVNIKVNGCPEWAQHICTKHALRIGESQASFSHHGPPPSRQSSTTSYLHPQTPHPGIPWSWRQRVYSQALYGSRKCSYLRSKQRGTLKYFGENGKNIGFYLLFFLLITVLF